MPTVAADVAFAAQNYGYPPEEVAARTRRALQQVHIEDCADRPVYRLSGGQKKLASIAGILTLDPELILMDEPSMGLSPLLVKEIFAIIREVNKQGITILLVEQNAKMALAISDRAYVLETGTITLSGDAQELLNDTRVKKAYLGQ